MKTDENIILENTENTENTVPKVLIPPPPITDNLIKETNNSKFSNISIISVLSGDIFQSSFFTKLFDLILLFFIISGFGFGIVSWFIIDNITGVGYILTGIFSSVSLISIKRMRLRATIQKSVNVLKEENEELKENNEELKENIDELEDNIDSLENTQKKLHEDLIILKETIGIFGENSDEIIDNLKSIYQNLKRENEIHANLNQNMIYLHILHIIKHYDTTCQFALTSQSLDKAKTALTNAFPSLNFDLLKQKIVNNKIHASSIIESINLQK